MMANRLSTALSAYLTSAAHQPVHWYAWSDEAFAAARAQDRPILLDIGAVWCHWCHVMDRESYEDPGLAAFLNERYVCIKVDRDERPDVDARYQRAVQALAGQGGWPLTAFLTPDGDVFHGGTYFPPDERLGRPAFRTVLERVLEAYRTQPNRVRASAGELRGRVGASLVEGEPGDLSAAMLDAAADRMARAFDSRNGGFGSQPKFPHPPAIEFLLARWWDTGESWMREIVERTLTGMALGGVHDQLGGGFHRYSVDARWIVPHFEKMSYDNAELLKAYLHAYAAFGTPLYRDVAEGIVRWNLEVMCDRERGGFAASQDADISLDDDGDYFTWTVAEAEAVLPEGERVAARLRWGIDPEGEMHHHPRRNVLHVARTTSQVAAEMGVGEADVAALLSSAAAKMRAARGGRAAPFVDRARYTNWNAMMAEAFLEASSVLGREDCRAFALQTLERLWAEAWRPGEGMAHRGAPLGTGPGQTSAPPDARRPGPGGFGDARRLRVHGRGAVAGAGPGTRPAHRPAFPRPRRRLLRHGRGQRHQLPVSARQAHAGRAHALAECFGRAGLPASSRRHRRRGAPRRSRGHTPRLRRRRGRARCLYRNLLPLPRRHDSRHDHNSSSDYYYHGPHLNRPQHLPPSEGGLAPHVSRLLSPLAPDLLTVASLRPSLLE